MEVIAQLQVARMLEQVSSSEYLYRASSIRWECLRENIFTRTLQCMCTLYIYMYVYIYIYYTYIYIYTHWRVWSPLTLYTICVQTGACILCYLHLASPLMHAYTPTTWGPYVQHNWGYHTLFWPQQGMCTINLVQGHVALEAHTHTQTHILRNPDPSEQSGGTEAELWRFSAWATLAARWLGTPPTWKNYSKLKRGPPRDSSYHWEYIRARAWIQDLEWL